MTPLRIAIISNEPDIGRMIQLYFERESWNAILIQISNKQEIEKRLQMFHPNIILIKISGSSSAGDTYSVCRLLKSNTVFNTIPIVAISTNKQMALESGATLSLDIVFDIETTHRAILQLIN